MKKVVAVVVTYNRKEKLKINIECLLNQTYKINKIIIIDNCSTDGTYDYIKEILNKNKIIKYIKLEKNTGGSGGFHAGLEFALKTNNDYIWGMDDDAFPERDALKMLMNHSNHNVCLWSNCNKDNDFEEDIKEVKEWMFVGFFIPCKIVKNIGLPRKDFFIFFDDYEYSKRIREYGYKIYKVKNSIINHIDSSSSNIIKKKILWKNPSVCKFPDWKLYYYVRNQILMYKWNEKEKWKRIIITLPKEFVKGIILGTKQSKIFLKAYFHGVIGKSGKIISP